MRRNGLIATMGLAVVMALLVFGAYEIGHISASSNSNSYNLGFNAGNATGFAKGVATNYNGPENNVSLSQASENYKAYFNEGNATGYAAGYQAGLHAQTNGTG